jgi:SagB-type dehydrogenase family enzyme
VAAGDDLLLQYHERSKHRLERYAPGPRGLDWANQPNPFREYAGAARTALTLAADGLGARYNDLRRGALPPRRPFDHESISILFELALGLSAWKSHGGNRWALRCNPSSGNLHPTEGYLACPSLPGIAGGVHHYVSRDHALEHRAAVTEPEWTQAFGARGVIVALTSIHWREAWKYGMRAWRYCQHDCGHAIAAFAYAAAALGWQARLMSPAADDDIESLLGLDRADDFAGAEQEAPDVLLWIGDREKPPDITRLLGALRHAQWSGAANRLSVRHVEWPDIESVHGATCKATTAQVPEWLPQRLPEPNVPRVDLAFERIARQRRSAVDFDGFTAIADTAFYSMLEPLLARASTPPWNALQQPANVHAAMMVHRVRDVEPGLYMLLRRDDVLDDLRQAMSRDWLWEKRGPAHLPLYFLLPYDLRDVSKLICCHQDIASDSCFALGMLADMRGVRREPWRYRELYWECGVLGHALYLEAEAAGIRATGIGCYFDDEMHALLGLHGGDWQSLYHFTAGGPIEDTRLATSPPYAT